MSAAADVPVSKAELFDDSALRDPWPVLAELRALGPVVWLDDVEMYALTRFDVCRDALRNPEVFSSASGVSFSVAKNELLGGRIMLCTDGEVHRTLRKVISAPLTPKALEAVRTEVHDAAGDVVERLVSQGTFDAATDLAHHLPSEVISRLVGIPEPGRQRLIDWAAAIFNTSGPENARSRADEPILGEFVEFMATECVPAKLVAGGWAQGIWDAASRGEIEAHVVPPMMMDYLAPSLDTTILGIGSMVELFATHPDQWALLRSRRDLTLNAVNEALRFHTVIRSFTRKSTSQVDIAEVALPAESWIAVLYMSANRDERHFPPRR